MRRPLRHALLTVALGSHAPGLAQEVSSEGTSADDAPDVVLVYGDGSADAALRALVTRARELGYEPRRRRDGTLRFVPSLRWKGAFTLGPGGLVFEHPFIVVRMPNLLALDVTVPLPQKIRSVQSEVRAELQPLTDHWLTLVREEAFDDRLDRVSVDLDRLWFEGIGLDGSRLLTAQERRDAVLAYWATRTDTHEGERVAEAIEAWLVDTLPREGALLSPTEVAAVESEAQHGRHLPAALVAPETSKHLPASLRF